MVRLIPIEQADFDAFVEQGIVEYAEDHVRNGNWSEDEALERSRNEWRTLLPDGPKTANEYIYSIFDDGTKHKVGILWVEVKMEQPRRKAFIYDLRIGEEFRGKGYGKKALQALDEKMKEMDVESVALHVFGHNTTAIELYKKEGYMVTNLHMQKNYR